MLLWWGWVSFFTQPIKNEMSNKMNDIHIVSYIQINIIKMEYKTYTKLENKTDLNNDSSDKKKYSEEQMIQIIKDIKCNKDKILVQCDNTLATKLIEFICKSDTDNFILNDIEDMLSSLLEAFTNSKGKDETDKQLIAEMYQHLVKYHELF